MKFRTWIFRQHHQHARYLLPGTLVLLTWIALVLANVAAAHELRPAYLHISEIAEDRYQVTWRVPARGDLRLSLRVQFDPRLSPINTPQAQISNGFYIERWQVAHGGGLANTQVQIDGLANTMTDALVRIDWRDGREQVARLLPDSPSLAINPQANNTEIAKTYFALGVEHILLGIDHLLFVLALVLLVSGWKSLLATITAFTVAHSLTLIAAVLGWLSLSSAPVEATIALSIVFLASEILQRQRGRHTLTTRFPWVVAFAFGLLHGLGFAGALAEIGVPHHAVPLSLALFNLGVEAGQLLFIAAVALVLTVIRHWGSWLSGKLAEGEHPSPATAGTSGIFTTPRIGIFCAYLIGAIAAYWLIERTLSIVL